MLDYRKIKLNTFERVKSLAVTANDFYIKKSQKYEQKLNEKCQKFHTKSLYKQHTSSSDIYKYREIGHFWLRRFSKRELVGK